LYKWIFVQKFGYPKPTIRLVAMGSEVEKIE